MNKFTFLILFLLFQTSFAQLTELISGLDSVTRLCVDGDFLYYAEDHAVSRINLLDENATSELLYDGFDEAGGVAIKDNLLFVADFGDSRIWKIDMSAQPFTATVLSLSPYPNSLDIYGDYLYWTDNNNDQLRKVNIYTGSTSTSTPVVYGNAMIGIDIYENYLYYSYDFYYVYRMDLTDEEAEHLLVANQVDYSNAILFHNGNVYVGSPGPNVIMRYDFTNEIPNNGIELLNQDDGLSYPTGLAIHNDILYIANSSRIYKYDTSLSTQENSLNNLTIYPNPATNSITINGLKDVVSYKLYNNVGKVVLSGSLSNFNSNLDVSTLSSGMYILNLAGSTNYKIVKN
ncbi:MAG TPA: T9SS type A sorting domain-containing protein [Flavobacteriaceae bacterium]|nr:T9SS type A sorting domain-containing protein [Flavobacteriaceae bacterium]